MKLNVQTPFSSHASQPIPLPFCEITHGAPVPAKRLAIRPRRPVSTAGFTQNDTVISGTLNTAGSWTTR